MPRPYSFSVTPDAPDADGLADNNASSGAAVTLDGALTSGGSFTSVDGLGHRLNITDTATVDQSGATFTITGTDANDNVLSEDVTGPASAATVESTKYFKTVTSITISNPAGSAFVDVGTVDEVATPIYVVDHYSDMEMGLAVILSGTIDATVQHTLDNILAGDTANADFLPHSSLAAITASADGNYDFGITGIRLVTNSYTSGATVKLNIISAC